MHYLNPASTSQIGSITGLLNGRRVGDKFYRENGDVLPADVNATRNFLARFHDPEIGRWNSDKQVRTILLKRIPDNRLGRLNYDSSCCAKTLSTESALTK